MGVVWSATNTNTLRRVALKMLKSDTATDPRVRKRFLREARAASAVQHPNIVEILDVVELEDGSPAMVMELLEGESLGNRLRQRTRLELGETAAVLLPALSAVGAAHALGIVHRDLKPDNIFLARGAEGEPTVKVLDFGIAKVGVLDQEAGPTELKTGTGTMLGTPYYMSPEQVFADAVIDYRSDIWAFGVILYQCLAGVRPTQADNVGQIMKIIMTGAMVPLEVQVPDLPPEVTSLVGRMLSSAREERPQSLKDVCVILRAHSTVKFPAFGDPIYVNIVARDPSSGSGEIPGPGAVQPPTLADSAAASPNSANEATRSEGRARRPPPGSGDSVQTGSTVGLTVPGEEPAPATHPTRAARWRWPALAAVIVTLGGTLVVGRLGAGRVATAAATANEAMPASPSATPPVRPSSDGSAMATPPSEGPPTSSATPSAAPAVSRATVAAPASDSAARVRRSETRPAMAPASVTPASSHVSSPGGLVEKPPF
jgi:serine/threonine protein kinase